MNYIYTYQAQVAQKLSQFVIVTSVLSNLGNHLAISKPNLEIKSLSVIFNGMGMPDSYLAFVGNLFGFIVLKKNNLMKSTLFDTVFSP